MPRRTELHGDSVEGNRRYDYLGGGDWSDAEACISFERELVSALRAGGDETAVRNRFIFETFLDGDPTGMTDAEVDDEVYDGQPCYDEVAMMFYLLDAGCVSAVAALYAAGCAPVNSCNGRAFAEGHQYREPIVVFYADPRQCPLLDAAAAKAGVDIGIGDSGVPVVVAARPESLIDFAEALLQLHTTIRRTPLRRARRYASTEPRGKSEQKPPRSVT